VKIDGERFVDMKEHTEMIQRRYDDKNKMRSVKREEQGKEEEEEEEEEEVDSSGLNCIEKYSDVFRLASEMVLGRRFKRLERIQLCHFNQTREGISKCRNCVFTLPKC
jgi:hypothetical protein